jgi:RND family efflux transporter MFP subunit
MAWQRPRSADSLPVKSQYCSKPPSNKKGPLVRLRSTTTLILSLIGLISGCGQSSPDALDAAQPIRPAYVTTVTESSAPKRHTFIGKVDAAQRVDLSFEVGGQIAQFDLRAGAQVTKGQLIAALDPTDFTLQREAAKAQRALAQSDLSRKQRLLKDQAISAALVDDAVSVLKLREAQLALAEKALADTRLTAPFAGHLAIRYLDNHMAIQAGEPIVRLNDLTELFIQISVPEKLFGALGSSDIASIYATLPAAGDRQFPLTLREYAGEASAVAQSYRVTFAMAPVPGVRVLPGMNATVVATRAASPPGIWIPLEALVTSPEGDFLVWVMDAKTETVGARTVTLGEAGPLGINVIQGLTQGEIIVTAGVQHLRAGTRIRPITP